MPDRKLDSVRAAWPRPSRCRRRTWARPQRDQVEGAFEGRAPDPGLDHPRDPVRPRPAAGSATTDATAFRSQGRMMLEVLAAAMKFVLYAGALAGAGTAFAAATLGNRLREASRYAPRLIALGSGLTLVAAIGNVLILIFRLGGSFDEPTLSPSPRLRPAPRQLCRSLARSDFWFSARSADLSG